MISIHFALLKVKLELWCVEAGSNFCIGNLAQLWVKEMLSNAKEVQVEYLAVAREKDEVVVASTVAGDGEIERIHDYEEDVKKVLRAPDYNFNTTQGSLYRIENDSVLHFMRCENGSVYFVISPKGYPQDKCRLLLADIIEGFKVRTV